MGILEYRSEYRGELIFFVFKLSKFLQTKLVDFLYRILRMVAAKWKEHMLLYLMQRKLKQLKEKAKFRESHAQPFQTKITKARNRMRDRSRGLAIMNELSHWEFERMFRMPGK